MSHAPAPPSLRLVTTKKPLSLSFFQGDPDAYPLDALELLPGLGTRQEHDCCLVVRYDDLAADQVEGDHLFLTLQEALADTQDSFGIGREDWVLPPGFDSIEAAYQAVVEAHVAAYGRPTPDMAAHGGAS